ncbi:type I secretion C-terminal target domain-containing protein, partial [Mesorhizobium sp. M7A.F.Ca.US.001.04.1.1]|uniref:beta strand repeat-containing protein n=2 Tax=unclassified Mesorhizobium TaxID=325217 RepID=UPI000FCC0BC3
PTAHADTNSVSEGAQASGNVLTDGTADVLGADGAAPGGAVTGVATGSNVSNPVSGNLGGAGIAGQYGTLVLGANGAYTYTANPNAVTTNAVDHFVYTITDGDGDTSTVTLDITVNNVTVTASDTDALVSEKGLATGSDAAGNSEIFNGAITPAGGTGPYTYTLTSPASGSYGNLVLNANGTYTYTLTQTYDGATTNNGITTEQDKDSFTYTVTDAHGNTTTGSILVDIVDDIPTAHADTNSVSEGAQASGNVLTDGTADVLGADGAAPGGAVTGVATGSNVSNPVSGNLGGAGIAGQYGTLVLGANGAYTYTANPNAVTTNAVDHFVYTITDGDGDTSTVTLDITVNNVTVTASDTDALVSEKGLATGSDAAGNSEIFNGAITPAGGTGPYTYTLTSPASGSYGNLVLNANGTYTYTLTQTYDGATTNNGITTEQDKDSFTYTVTDAHGNTTTGSILVDIVDDIPTLGAFTPGTIPNEVGSVNGLFDFVAGADGVNHFNIAGPAITGISYSTTVQSDGKTVLLAETSTGTDIYSLTLHPDGTYAFALITPDAATTVTQTLTGLSPGGPTPFLETPDGLIEFTGTGTGVNSSTQGFGVADQFIEKDENFTMEFHTSSTAGNDAPTLNPKFIGSLDFAATGNSSGSVSWVATNSVTGDTRSGTATVTNGHLVIDPSIDFNLISITGDAGSKIRLSAVDISQTILPSDTTLHFQVSAVDGDGDVSATQSLDIHQVAASSGGSFTLPGFAGTVNDVIAGSTHIDTISGGAGTDIADYTGSAAVSINLTDAGGAAGVHGTPSNPSDGNITGGDATGDTLTGIEGLIGGSGDDYLYGNSGANYLAGGLGNDTLRGEGGADTLIGGAGNDLLVGGAGSDTLTGGTGADTFRLENLDIKDLITDFNGGDGDKIDLTALFDSTPANVGNFVNYDAGTGVLSVDTSGSGDPANFVQVAELTNHPAANTITLLYDDGITQHQTTANVV